MADFPQAARPWFFWVTSAAVFAWFLFFRLYRLPQSLLFFNDMGRDFLELYEWRHTGLPPLLGPQTSVISFNQSAVYFYWLYPFYLLSFESAYASVISLLVTAAGFFFVGVIFTTKHLLLRRRFLLTGFLLALQPLVVSQNRFIWNPSFVPFFLTAAFFIYPLLLGRRPPRAYLHWFAVMSALAVSFNYSAAPVVLSALLFGIYYWRRAWWRPWLLITFYFTLINLPTVAFEIRHHLALTRLLFEGQRTGITAQTLSQKILGLSHLVQPNLTWISLSVFLSLSVYLLWLFYHRRASLEVKSYPAVFWLSLLLTLALPVAVETHYLFGFVSLLILLIASLPQVPGIIFTTVITLLWLQPLTPAGIYRPAVRTVNQLQACYRNFCAKNPGPYYVSMQSGLLPYHNAPEHRYFMLMSGCDVKSIEKGNSEADRMVVVADNSTYEHAKTDYHELTQFGPAAETGTYVCEPNLKLHLITKL